MCIALIMRVYICLVIWWSSTNRTVYRLFIVSGRRGGRSGTRLVMIRSNVLPVLRNLILVPPRVLLRMCGGVCLNEFFSLRHAGIVFSLWILD